MPPFSHSILDCFWFFHIDATDSARCHSKLMHGWQPSLASIATFMIEAKCPHAQLEDGAKCPKNALHWPKCPHVALTTTWKIGAKCPQNAFQSALMWHWQPLERLGKVPSECLASQSALMWHWQPLGRLGQVPSSECPALAKVPSCDIDSHLEDLGQVPSSECLALAKVPSCGIDSHLEDWAKCPQHALHWPKCPHVPSCGIDSHLHVSWHVQPLGGLGKVPSCMCWQHARASITHQRSHLAHRRVAPSYIL